MISCRGLGCAFEGRFVVDDIDLEVEAGELMVLIGASGSGKTTTLKMINRLIEPTRGDVFVNGESTREIEPHVLRRRIGYGAQRAGLFPHLDVAANVGITPRLLGWDRDRIAARVDALLERVHLEPDEVRHRSIEGLSGGEQQRVSLARALAAEPRVLLLDEPFGALDPVTRDALQDSLLELKRDLGLTIVFVTHDMSEAILLGDRIAFLEQGRLERVGAPADLLADPRSDAVAAFLRAPRRQASQIDALLAETAPPATGPDSDGEGA